MTHRYSTQTLAPNLDGLNSQFQIELLDGHQWKKGATTLILDGIVADQHLDTFMKSKTVIKCPKNRGMTQDIFQEVRQALHCMSTQWKKDILGNGVVQWRLSTRAYRISWYTPAEGAGESHPFHQAA